MAKTSRQIQGDIYSLVRNSELFSVVSGEVYRRGHRPRDSTLEDIIVHFSAGMADQAIQTGIVIVNIYVPDIDPFNDGTLREDTERTELLEIKAAEWVDSLTTKSSNYRFSLNETIATDHDEEISQHFVVVRLRYHYFGPDK